MRYFALATDYDGTIARHGRVNDETLAALRRLRESGRRLILVTGREIEDLKTVFPHLDLFDSVVAENGALIHNPADHTDQVLAERPPEKFINTLRERGVVRVSQGKVIVATWHPYEQIVLETIRDMGLELQVIFNKDSVMVLPTGINKATGLSRALEAMGLSAHNTVGVGDAENDHAFLSLCECSAAVDNALPTLKERADIVLTKDHGEGVQDLIAQILEDDLKSFEPRLSRHELVLGAREDGTEVRIPPYGASILIAGTSGGGKSTFAQAILERLADNSYQFCIIDPEGDYTTLEGAIVLGDSRTPPTPEELIHVLQQPATNLVVNMIGVSLDHRPGFFETLLPRIQELKSTTGRPHWLLIDETHHLLPAAWGAATPPFTGLGGLVLVTVHPQHVSRETLSAVDIIIAIGKEPGETIAGFSKALGIPAPPIPNVSLKPGEGIFWRRTGNGDPFWFRSIPPRIERKRHFRKYIEGELTPEQSFYFRGPGQKLNLRAQNLTVFLQMAEGVDDDTWMYHLHRKEYSKWILEFMKDNSLAEEIESAEKQNGLSPQESRRIIREAIERRYTAPA